MPNFSNKTRTAANLDAMVFRGYLGIYKNAQKTVLFDLRASEG